MKNVEAIYIDKKKNSLVIIADEAIFNSSNNSGTITVTSKLFRICSFSYFFYKLSKKKFEVDHA